MKVVEILEKTGLNIDEITSALVASRLKPPFTEQTEIPEKIAEMILKTTSKLVAFSQLQPATETLQTSTTTPEKGDTNEITKDVVRSIAQMQGTTQKQVLALINALEQKNMRVALEVAYLKRSRYHELQQAEKVGEQIADYQQLLMQNQELDEKIRAERMRSYNVETAFQDVFGMSASELSQVLQQQTEEFENCNEQAKQALSLLKMGKSDGEIFQILGKKVEDILSPTQIKMQSFMKKAS